MFQPEALGRRDVHEELHPEALVEGAVEGSGRGARDLTDAHEQADVEAHVGGELEPDARVGTDLAELRRGGRRDRGGGVVAAGVGEVEESFPPGGRASTASPAGRRLTRSCERKRRRWKVCRQRYSRRLRLARVKTPRRPKKLGSSSARTSSSMRIGAAPPSASAEYETCAPTNMKGVRYTTGPTRKKSCSRPSLRPEKRASGDEPQVDAPQGRRRRPQPPTRAEP